MNNRVKGYIDGICKNVLKDNGLQIMTSKDGKEAITSDKGGFIAYLPIDEEPNVLTTANRIIRAVDAFDPNAFPVIAREMNPYADEQRMVTLGENYKDRMDKAVGVICEELGTTRDPYPVSLDKSVLQWIKDAYPHSRLIENWPAGNSTFRDLERNFKLGTFTEEHGGELVAKEFLSRAEKEQNRDFVLDDCVKIASDMLMDKYTMSLLEDKGMMINDSKGQRKTLSVFNGAVPEQLYLPFDDSLTLSEKIIAMADSFDPFVFATRMSEPNKDTAMQVAEMIQGDLNEIATDVSTKYNLSRNELTMTMEAPISWWFNDAYPEIALPEEFNENVTFKNVEGMNRNDMSKALGTDDQNIIEMVELSIMFREELESRKPVPVQDIKDAHNNRAGKEQNRPKEQSVGR